METKASAYFSSLNPFSKKIVNDQNFVKNFYGDEWEKFDLTKQEDLIDDYIVDPDTRKKYVDHPESNSTAPQSFPKLVVQSGEKIVVDYGNDYWTWQDEHSAPFSWKSKSQENLSLIDLEPEELSKPPSKSKKKSAPSKPQSQEKSEKPFSWKPDKSSSIWNSPLLAGMKKSGGFKVIPSSPEDKLLNDSDVSRDDESNICVSPEQNVDVQENEDMKYQKIKTKKSPSRTSKKSPKGSISRKFPLSPSFTKNTGSDSTVSLVSDTSLTKDENRDRRSSTPSKSSVKEDNAFDNLALERSAFDNPATLDDEWSSFVGERNMTDSLSSATSSPSHQLLKEPQTQSKDQIDARESVSKSPSLSSNVSGDMDTSSLLKNPEYENATLTVTNRLSGLDLAKESELGTSTSSQKTGFDFLDDW